jgi:hypothetical protein
VWILLKPTLHDQHGTTSQRTAIFIFTTVKPQILQEVSSTLHNYHCENLKLCISDNPIHLDAIIKEKLSKHRQHQIIPQLLDNTYTEAAGGLSRLTLNFRSTISHRTLHENMVTLNGVLYKNLVPLKCTTKLHVRTLDAKCESQN